MSNFNKEMLITGNLFIALIEERNKVIEKQNTDLLYYTRNMEDCRGNLAICDAENFKLKKQNEELQAEVDHLAECRYQLNDEIAQRKATLENAIDSIIKRSANWKSRAAAEIWEIASNVRDNQVLPVNYAPDYFAPERRNFKRKIRKTK